MANILNIKTRIRRKKLLSKVKENTTNTFELRDLRERDWFTVDNEFVKGKWLRLLKGCPTSVYFALCRHADEKMLSFPGVLHLIDETGYGKLQIMRSIKMLEFHRLISVDREKGQHNIYSLLNKRHWRKTIVVKKYILSDRGKPPSKQTT
jgi:hypothetical protein